MALRGFARATKRLYLAHARRFLEGRTRNPGSDQEVRQWLLSLIEAGRSHSYVGQALSALRFLHVHVLEQPAPVMRVPRPKRKRQLPPVLAAPLTSPPTNPQLQDVQNRVLLGVLGVVPR